MEVERLFFIYAYPAIESCARIDDLTKERLERLVLEGGSPKREELEKLLPMAFKRMRSKIGENYWSVEGVRRYWWQEHNKIIDNLEEGYENSLPEQRENCKVKFCFVYEVLKDFVDLRERNGNKIKALNYLKYELKKGDFVTVHKNHIIEKVGYREFCKYG